MAIEDEFSGGPHFDSERGEQSRARAPLSDSADGQHNYGRALSSRWSLSRVAVVAFSAVLAVSVGIAWWSSRPVDPIAVFDADSNIGVAAQVNGVVPAANTEAGDPGAGAAESPGDATSGAPAQSAIVVHVVGQVKQPGVVRVLPGARGADAVAAAGGLTAKADVTAVNLAAFVSDGQQLVIPKRGKAGAHAGNGGIAADGSSVGTGSSAGSGSSAGTGASSGNGAGTGSTGQGIGQSGSGGATATAPGSGSLVNLNHASAPELESLPGIGPALAGRIIAWRETNGPFTSVEQLTQVSGIGEVRFESLRELITV